MHVLYEEEGDLKVATVLAQSGAALQVESPHGRRSKVKSTHVLMSFERPAAPDLLAQAERFAAALDTDFLWQCSGAAEFGFEELAREYVGRQPDAAEAAGVLLKLHSAPMYFHRRSRGRFQAAPPETLKAALAGLEKKRRVQEQIAGWVQALTRFECPAEIERLREELLYAPDRNKPEAKAFEQACKTLGLSAARLFERCGRLPDSHDYHLNRFLHEFFPGGIQFPPHEVPEAPPDLPLAEVDAFSLDDVGTTEIDDAFSVVRVAQDRLRVGIHIAAPALGFAPDTPLGAIARERLSTAYMPGRKFTMLPDDVVERFSLDHGSHQTAVSLYLDVSLPNYTVRIGPSRLEQVRIAANLRHAEYDTLNELFVSGASAGLKFEEELRSLWRLATALEAKRGKPSVGAGANDYTFTVENGRVSIARRKRGAPLDKLVAELMILANTTWGTLLAERDFAAIYRVQSTGKVRMSVHPEAHEGLGVSCYAWMTSPLRRYVDLVNQWQLAAALAGRRAPYARTSEALLSAVRAFEVTYARYDEHQRAMENYWCLRWLGQENVRVAEAVVVRENLVRFEGLPLTVRVPSLPELEPDARVRLDVGEIDLIERTVACTFREKLGSPPPPDTAISA